MTITRNQADELRSRLAHHGTFAAVAHQIRVELRAIEPYTNRQLDRVREIADVLAGRDDAAQARAMAFLASAQEAQ